MMSSNNNANSPSIKTMNQLEFFKKAKYLNPVELSISITGSLFLTVILLCSVVYFDYDAVGVSGGLMSRAGFTWFSVADKPSSVSDNSSSGVVVEREWSAAAAGECDYSDGKWVWDDNYPLYDAKDCPFVDDGFRCLENGRPDNFFTKWRWQPNNCNLPRFNPKVFLELYRNKRIVFVGDSIGRNQWESLLCMLASAVPDKSSIYEMNGNPITKHMGFLVFMFRDYNCTVEYYRAPFITVQGRAPPGAPANATSTLRVDQLEWSSKQWIGADVMIFNAGHWWNYEKTLRGGCYFQEGDEVKLDMSVETAFRRSIETLVRWIDEEVDVNKTSVFFRSYAPVHFSGGDWKTGGTCHTETLPDFEIPSYSDEWGHFGIVHDVLSDHANKTGRATVKLLNVTYLTQQRRDGHTSLYYMAGSLAPIHKQDCSHWCLSGVPDTWNELLYAALLKKQPLNSWNSTSAIQSEV